MTYNPKEFVEKQLPKAGTRIDATVKEVSHGTIGDFIAPDVLVKWDNADPNGEAIEVHAETSDGLIRKVVITLPADKSVHPRSKLAQWKKAYGEYPHEGQDVYLITDAEGFAQFQV
jgi:hypothetical protein